MIPKTTSDSSEVLADDQWLTSADAEPWLARAEESREDIVKLTQALRSELSAARTHRVLELVELRRRAKSKFAKAARMFFTRVGLEQATDEIVAAYKAARFPAKRPVADLCCGMGGDCLALAGRGPTVGVDRDPALAHLVRANLAVSGYEQSTICVADVEQFSLAEFAAWHIDPDRRPQGKRTTRVELHEPGPDAIERLLKDCPHAAVKLAPAAELPPDWAQAAEAEWISRDGECKQLVAWFGDVAKLPGQRAATVLSSRNHSPRTVVGAAHHDYASAQAVGRYIYEVDAAVLAAKLTGVLAAEHALAAIDPHGGYLTGDRRIEDGALAVFEVLETLPFDRKRLKGALHAQRIGRLEIKKRALFDDPEKLRRDLALSGDEQATLILTRIQDRATAIIAKRCDETE